MRSLIEKIYPAAEDGWIKDVGDLWRYMVSRGYEDPEVRKSQSWVSVPDCFMLYLMVKYYKPKVIFELGTYIGTSTNIMAMALEDDGVIYTCDRNHKYIPHPKYHRKIRYYNKESERVLPKIERIDFCFIDGTFRKKDAKVLCSKMSKGSVFSAHDCYGVQKGIRNMKSILKRHPGKAYYPEKYKIGYDIDGTLVNSSVGVVEW